MSINAVKGVEIGDGFASVAQKGSEHADEISDSGFASNHAGGILGGHIHGTGHRGDPGGQADLKHTHKERATVDKGGKKTRQCQPPGDTTRASGYGAVPIAEGR